MFSIARRSIGVFGEVVTCRVMKPLNQAYRILATRYIPCCGSEALCYFFWIKQSANPIVEFVFLGELDCCQKVSNTFLLILGQGEP
jgi:hypothetical protein